MAHGATRSGSARRGGLIVTGILAALVLAGCTSNPVQPEPDPTSSPQPSESAPAVEPEPDAPEPVGIPVGLACEQLVTPEQVYEFNPNFGVDPGYAPAPGSVAEQIVGLQGVACGWLNQTSGETIEVAVAHLAPEHVEARKNALVQQSHMVPTYNQVADEGYFTTDGTVGRADLFRGEFWILSRSPIYFEPGDAEQFVAYVANAVG